MIEVLKAGLLTTVQDRGRPGFAHVGVPPSGALDAEALDLANRLVGNVVGAAGLELTVAGPTLRFHIATTIALCGADARPRIGHRSGSVDVPINVRAGEVVEVGAISHGARLYLAVRGGIDVPRVLSSRSTDTLSGLGPAPLREGMRVAIGDEHDGWPGVDLAPRPAYDPSPVLAVLPGPHAGELSHAQLADLFGATYQVTPESNRVALRLDGTLTVASIGEVASLGIVTGAIQLPPSGQPILFLNDHPTTGGYPIVGVVVTADVRRAAQLRPGDTLRFGYS
jgi:biotin-dependent carboxylase-like uncharacterized protein